MFRAVPAALDRHIVEFLPGWLAEGAYYGRTPGIDAYSFEGTIEWGERIYREMVEEANGDRPVETDADGGDGEAVEAVPLLRALWGDAPPCELSVNLPNTGQVTNLSLRAVIEGTAVVGAGELRPVAFGDLPPGFVAFLDRHLAVQALTVEAALSGNRGLVVQAMLADGHVREPSAAEALTDALLDAHRSWLPQF